VGNLTCWNRITKIHLYTVLALQVSLKIFNYSGKTYVLMMGGLWEDQGSSGSFRYLNNTNT